MAANTKVYGEMAFLTARALKPFQVAENMKAHGKMAFSMDKELMLFPMAENMLVYSLEGGRRNK